MIGTQRKTYATGINAWGQNRKLCSLNKLSCVCVNFVLVQTIDKQRRSPGNVFARIAVNQQQLCQTCGTQVYLLGTVIDERKKHICSIILSQQPYQADSILMQNTGRQGRVPYLWDSLGFKVNENKMRNRNGSEIESNIDLTVDFSRAKSRRNLESFLFHNQRKSKFKNTKSDCLTNIRMSSKE